MIEILKAILFGIVEGITEWLPVSSTGHLILLDEFIKLDVTPEFYEMFQVVIQLGAILAVIVLFFHKRRTPGRCGSRSSWQCCPVRCWGCCWTIGWMRICITISPWL